ncbi:MAG: DUF2125 domain-containing protein [Hypericibacter sp.]
MTRKSWIAALIAVLVLAGLAGGWALWWHEAAGRFATSIDLWIAARRAEGYKIEAQRDPIGGFPFRLRTRIAAPTAAAGDGSWSWSGPDLAIDAPAWSPLDIAFAMPGAHQVQARGHHYEVEAKTAEGLLSLATDGRLDRFRLTAGGISAQEPDKPAATIESLYATVSQPAPDPAAAIAASLAFDLGAENVTMPPDPRLALGPKLDHLATSGRLEGPLPRGFDAASLAAWRDAGGAVDLDLVGLAWGPLRLTGSGTFALDDQLRPLAAANTSVQGTIETLQALADAGLMKPNDAQLAALGLALLSDGQGRVKLPLTAQDGELRSGPLKLAKLAPVVR